MSKSVFGWFQKNCGGKIIWDKKSVWIFPHIFMKNTLKTPQSEQLGSWMVFFFLLRKKDVRDLNISMYLFMPLKSVCASSSKVKKSLGSLPIITMFNSTLLIAQLPDWSLKTLPVEAAHYNLLLLVSCFFSAVPLVFLVTVWFQRKILIRKSLTFRCLSVYDSLELQIQLRVFSSIYIMNKTFPSLYFLFDWTWKRRLPKI